MERILTLFSFTHQEEIYVFGRLGVELLGMIVIAYVVATLILAVTKNKRNKIGFSNWFKVCFMYGMIFDILVLGVISILTIRYNGLSYFSLDNLGFNWLCGYLLMLPELLLMVGCLAVYTNLTNSIHQSLN